MAIFAPKQRSAVIPVSTGSVQTRLVTAGSLSARRPAPDLHPTTTAAARRQNQTGEVEEQSSERETKSRQLSASASLSRTDFTRIPVHALPAPAIQTKLAINKPGDQYEQEADRVADQVMRMPDPTHADTPPLSKSGAPTLQRKCDCGGSCEECKQAQDSPSHGLIQRKPQSESTSAPAEAPPIVHEVLRSPGQPLDPATRAFMEPRFGHDFSHIENDLLSPTIDEIRHARPLAAVLPADVLAHVVLVATTLCAASPTAFPN
jgi:hypothetical protein